jgi:hypothetical protein
MKSFKDLGIASTNESFKGEKIEIYNVLNREIVVNDYKIEPSNFPEKGNGKRLTLQITHEQKEHVIFTGSVILQDLIAQVTKDDLPFTTTIIKLNPKGYMFT